MLRRACVCEGCRGRVRARVAWALFETRSVKPRGERAPGKEGREGGREKNAPSSPARMRGKGGKGGEGWKVYARSSAYTCVAIVKSGLGEESRGDFRATAPPRVNGNARFSVSKVLAIARVPFSSRN